MTPKTKVCRTCEKRKGLDEFYTKSKDDDTLRTQCKECVAANTRANYRLNTEKRKKYVLDRIRRNHNFVREWKTQRGCEKCGCKVTACLDIHHVDPSKKEYTVAHMVTAGLSIKTIEKELEICTVLCANCHRIAHWSSDPGNHNGT